MGLNEKLKTMATQLQDEELLARFAAGVVIAIEAKYHNNCLLRFKNRYRSFEHQASDDHDSSINSHKQAQPRNLLNLLPT